MIGTMLGQFRIFAKLGDGGVGEVFLSENTTLRRRVAIKRLSGVLGNHPHWVTRLRREAIALAAVNHPKWSPSTPWARPTACRSWSWSWS